MSGKNLTSIGDAVKAYWDNKIRIWSETSYDPTRPVGLVNKIFKRLRTSIDARLKYSCEILAPTAKGKSVLDIGCGVGLLGLQLIGAGCSHYTGMDISSIAIEEARKRAQADNKLGSMDFICADLQNIKSFPDADITVGLGLLDWIPLDEVDRLMGKLKGRKILFTYSEQDNSFKEWVHRIYLVKRLEWKKSGVYAYHFKRKDIAEILSRHGFCGIKYVKNRAMRFGVIFHNLHE